ncbi:iron complex outermembrane receptor protein [Pseudoduganella flava]|uniref:Iron complex outermembrane receptor protein n=1 Tax=Pseudoduganella flava TaxID=871742 RepID=A0A562P6P3_9BURK|nr:TonB-dependent receptor [Pseudoduganella flava]QGZ40118.1 TonB-dependent receptor [Pseudoduganella flava]TWI40137.1 iron complex outermembrane receptor protein [Pseudoduganella flava]
MRYRPLSHAIAALCGVTLAPLACAADEPVADVVVVSASRAEHGSFDLPASIDVVDAARIRDNQMRVNASESLTAVPGVVAQNRQNYAQDLQISSRGFGARSAFGVRGVRLIADGIPATMPDGQGQAATFDLDVAERIEVLRGPFSAIYGNHAGGVIQLFTREPDGPPAIETTLSAGSDGARKADVIAEGRAGGVGFLLDASRFDTDGYRDHSAARRDQGMAKLTFTTGADGKVTIVAGALRQKDTQDPLGATWATYLRDPRANEIDASDTQTPRRTLAERYDTRKSIDHQQGGATWEQRFGDDRLRMTVYGGNREVVQYQAFSRAFQASPSHSGGVVDFDRDFYGADVNWLDVRPLAGGRLSTTAGIEYGRSQDYRTGYENFVGNTFGVRGQLRRDEEDTVSNADPYLQSEWQGEKWQFTGGLRHSRVRARVDDRYLSNGDDSGDLRFARTTPVAAVLYKVSPTLNAYVSAARGFEAPTLNELFYSGQGAGFNFALRPARSTHVEAGVKAIAGNVRVDAALFQARTRDELVVDASSGGRTSYRNAGRTLRQGGELSVAGNWSNGISARISATVLRAIFDEAVGNVRDGSRLPGVPSANLFGEVAWTDRDGRFGAAVETIASAKVYPEETNAEQPAPGYAIVNLRANATQAFGPWRLRAFARVNNVFDRQYVGSVIVGDANKRYYEAAPQRNWMLGASARYQF